MQGYNLHILFRNPYKSLGGVGITYGYDINENKIIIIHPINSEIVKRIFDLRIERKPHEEIYSIIKEEFIKRVNEYNKKYDLKKSNDLANENFNDENMDTPIVKDIIEEDYKLDNTKKLKQRDFGNFSAYIPSAKKISEIVTDTGRIKYIGKRRYEFELNFDEDARIQNDFLKGSITPFKFDTGEKFIKGRNAITFDTPKLKILSEDKFEKITQGIIRRRLGKIEISHTYNGILFCKCGTEITAKTEGGTVYYRCNNASNKNGCHRATRIPEARIDEFVEKGFLAYLRVNKNNKEEFEKLVIESKKACSEHIKYRLRTANGNLTKFKNALKETNNSTIHQGYVDKIEKIELEIEEMNEEINNLQEITKKQLIDFFTFTNDFHLLDRSIKRLMVSFIFEKIEMDEIQEEEYTYKNPYNRLKNVQYQKIISNAQLTPYLHELFILNSYHNAK